MIKEIELAIDRNNTFVDTILLFLNFFSIIEYEILETIIVIIINNAFFNRFPSVNSIIFANAKIGKCQRYSEYDIRPVVTKTFDDKIFVKNPFLLANHIIKHTPIRGELVKKVG